MLPISSLAKYLKLPQYKYSPIFIITNKRKTNHNDLGHKFIHGTVMIKHLRGIDPRKRCLHSAIASAKEVLPRIRLCVKDSI